MEHDPLCDGRCNPPYLSELDRKARHDEAEEHFGDDVGCGGAWGWEPPCGGCVDCAHAMVSHYFYEERDRAYRFHAAGLEYANPRVIDTTAMATAGGGYSWGSHHSRFDCMVSGEDVPK